MPSSTELVLDRAWLKAQMTNMFVLHATKHLPSLQDPIEFKAPIFIDGRESVQVDVTAAIVSGLIIRD